MVYILTLPEGSGHVAHFVKHFGRRHSRTIAEATYGEFLGRREIPSGVYIFADRDRMTPDQRAIACRLWDTLAVYSNRVKLLNNPHHQWGRYELLQALYQRGVNDFRVWRIDELPDDISFPVFVRKENDHHGPRSGLLHSMEEVWRALAALALEGVDPKNMLVCQYLETVEEDGIYRKYGAWRIGEKVYGQYLILERRWEKSHGERVRTEESKAANQNYFCQNPHAELLRPYFQMAGVEYGRMDYSFSKGRLQIWEINDNAFLAAPILAHYIAETGISKYLDGLETLQREVSSENMLSVDFPWTEWGSKELGAEK